MSIESNSPPGPVRFFAYSNGNGFSKFEPINSRMGHFWVMGKREKSWVLAGCNSHVWVEDALSSGMFFEFSPAALLGGAKSEAKASASRANGAKGGRPRKVV